jgi:hypothetical protein
MRLREDRSKAGTQSIYVLHHHVLHVDALSFKGPGLHAQETHEVGLLGPIYESVTGIKDSAGNLSLIYETFKEGNSLGSS